MILRNGLAAQDSLTSWDFNMLELDEATGNHALSCYAFFVWQVC